MLLTKFWIIIGSIKFLRELHFSIVKRLDFLNPLNKISVTFSTINSHLSLGISSQFLTHSFSSFSLGATPVLVSKTN